MKPPIDRQLVRLLAWVTLFQCGHAHAADWPLVRGDILGTGVAQAEVSDSPQLFWKFAAGKDSGFDATAVIADGVVYIGDNAGVFHAVKLEDGSEVWRKEFPDDGFSAGAAVEKSRVYVGDMNGMVYCFATSDGKELWNKNLGGEVHAGPTIHGEHVLFTCESGALACLDKNDGSERWQFHIEAPLRCTPTISAGRAALAGCDSRLHMIDVTNGKETSSVEIDAPTGSTPAMRGEHVYFGTEGGTFYAINIALDRNQPSAIAWMFRDPQRSQPIRTAAAVNEHIVVFGGQGKEIHALKVEDGHELWKLPTKARVESSPVIIGDRVVAATTAGKIYLLDAATGEAKWEYEAGGSFIASPAVADGRIILGNTDGTMYCFGAKK
jgi:outer membrane protein assembly factor BamB